MKVVIEKVGKLRWLWVCGGHSGYVRSSREARQRVTEIVGRLCVESSATRCEPAVLIQQRFFTDEVR